MYRIQRLKDLGTKLTSGNITKDQNHLWKDLWIKETYFSLEIQKPVSLKIF